MRSKFDETIGIIFLVLTSCMLIASIVIGFTSQETTKKHETISWMFFVWLILALIGNMIQKE